MKKSLTDTDVDRTVKFILDKNILVRKIHQFETALDIRAVKVDKNLLIVGRYSPDEKQIISNNWFDWLADEIIPIMSYINKQDRFSFFHPKSSLIY